MGPDHIDEEALTPIEIHKPNLIQIATEFFLLSFFETI